MRQLISIDKLIEQLLYQTAAGAAHGRVASGLSMADPVVLNAAPTFFAMTIDAHLFDALMAAARIHDDQPNAITIHTLLKRAAQEPAKFDKGGEVAAAISSARVTLDGLKRELTRLDKWRNRKLAHNQSLLHDPQFAAQEARKQTGDLYSIFEGTGQIVNEFSRLYRDIYASLTIIDQNDYEMVISYISDVKCQRVHDYEKEFRKPADFPRPANYDRWLERQARR
jgi:AbiU2